MSDHDLALEHSFQEGEAPEAGAGLFGMDPSEEDSKLLIIPVPWDATTSYGRGAAEAPGVLIRASHQLDLEDLSYGAPWKAGIRMQEIPSDIRDLNVRASTVVREIRRGGHRPEEVDRMIAEVNGYSAELSRYTEDAARKGLQAGKIVALLGGDHSSPLGAIRAVARERGAFGILHIDAHFDLRVAYEGFTESHASIMYNLLEQCPELTRLVQVGIRDFCAAEKAEAAQRGDRVRVFYDQDLFRHKALGHSFDLWVRQVLACLPEQVWLSFDIDGLSADYCPSTGTPVPGGLSFHEAQYLLEQLAYSGRKIIGFDLCEVAPDPQGHEWDLNVGARILYKLCGAALYSQGYCSDSLL